MADQVLGASDPATIATLKKVLLSWGPGFYDAEVNIDGNGFRPDGKSAAVRIPAAYGHLGENLHTWTGGFGNVTYWNAYVANLQMHGKGNFNDERFNDPVKYPAAVRGGFFKLRHNPDQVTSKLAPLHYYQLSLKAPKPPAGSFDPAAAKRGEAVFNGQGRCSDCHMPPLYTDSGYNAHTPAEMCIDSFQADRGPTGAIGSTWSRRSSRPLGAVEARLLPRRPFPDAPGLWSTTTTPASGSVCRNLRRAIWSSSSRSL